MSSDCLKTEPPLLPVDFKTITPSPPQLIEGITPDIPVEVVLIFTKSKVEVLPVPEFAFKTLEYIYPFVSRLTNVLAVIAVSISADFKREISMVLSLKIAVILPAEYVNSISVLSVDDIAILASA